ncbi:siderophore-interacting protein [Yersinia massiliensis]|uniref:Siderophore-interacting protein n=1 Tax=Yersinia massiliensis TaxID=419257 RepID=A0AA90XWJ1_9GAMM|nr:MULTISPECIES: siderophore-interacting protein [Yersinia]MDA5546810.1 siderophore-interacting protein [Yersinia massiliensis]NIL26757.1 siderophore-interacting protein [Yersinia massiliensis]OWF74231.1 siderophore-interacting protein [Yersinia frederiksenii]PHZ23386.1 siderophore-interacting protein [Yersinia massiliensis]UZM78454.1 siderophore-interacting protein [Yersinia massiliensis]
MSGSSSYRIFDIKLKAKENVSPSLMRCVFEGAEVNRMKLEAPDQRIKLLFPAEDGQIPQLEKSDDWYRSYMALPKAQRPVMRTYTLRALRTEQNEMDVEFVLHGETGPASAWATHAKAGDAIQVVAPNAEHLSDSGGYEWSPPAQMTQALLIADETALPAAVAILEQLALQINPPQVQAFFEVPLAGDCLSLEQYQFAQIHWLPRDVEGQSAHGRLLVDAVRQSVQIPDMAQVAGQSLAENSLGGEVLWERAEGEKAFYAWVAAESSTVKVLRRYLIGERGLDRSTVNFMAYWC